MHQGKAHFEAWAARLFRLLGPKPELITLRQAGPETCGEVDGRRY